MCKKVTEILVFGFELFICGLYRKKELTSTLNCQLFNNIGWFVSFLGGYGLTTRL
jgi:hypothetical protein